MEWVRVPDELRLGWSRAMALTCGPVAQWLAQLPNSARDPGSIPASGRCLCRVSTFFSTPFYFFSHSGGIWGLAATEGKGSESREGAGPGKVGPAFSLS